MSGQQRLRDLLTVVVVSSPVPSNPDTTTLRAVFASLALVRGLPRCPKLVQFDGPQPALPERRKSKYVEFKSRVRELSRSDPDFQPLVVSESSKFLFSAHNLAAAVGLVNTSYMFVLQHDYQVARAFDVRGLLRTMQNNSVVKHVRLNMRPNVARGFDGVIANYSGPSLVPLTMTCGWSDAPHITPVAYYREFVIPLNRMDHRGGGRKFMEESVHYRMQRNFKPGGCWELKQAAAKGVKPLVWPADFSTYGTFLYGLASATDGTYTVHRSLRGNAPQWGLDHDPKGLRARSLPARSRLLSTVAAQDRSSAKSSRRLKSSKHRDGDTFSTTVIRRSGHKSVSKRVRGGKSQTVGQGTLGKSRSPESETP